MKRREIEFGIWPINLIKGMMSNEGRLALQDELNKSGLCVEVEVKAA